MKRLTKGRVVTPLRTALLPHTLGVFVPCAFWCGARSQNQTKTRPFPDQNSGRPVTGTDKTNLFPTFFQPKKGGRVPIRKALGKIRTESVQNPTTCKNLRNSPA